ncbi:hypothetical protein [Streptosporangium canum]|uniref:hypothetical protein n=1 Tax=Streptosporangium canum TaxID=324952 RepID=UPI003416EF06
MAAPIRNAAHPFTGGAFTTPVVDADPDGPAPWPATGYVPGPSLTATGCVIGSAGYTSPERIAGPGNGQRRPAAFSAR